MKGRSVLDEAIAGSGRAGDLHHELEDLQRAMEDPGACGRDGQDPRPLRPRAGRVRASGRLRAGGAGARGAARPGLPGRPDRRRCGCAFGRVEDARGAGARAAGTAGCAADGRTDQPPGYRVDHLAGAVSQVLRWRAADDLARPRVHEPHRLEDRGDRCGRDHRVLGRLRFLRARADHSRDQPAGGVRAAAGDAGQGAALHRPLPDARGQGGAGAEPHQGAGQDREDRAAEEAPGGEVRVSRSAALGRSGGGDRGSAQELRHAGDLRRVQSHGPPRRALGGDGQERRGQDDAAQDDRRRAALRIPEMCGWARA